MGVFKSEDSTQKEGAFSPFKLLQFHLIKWSICMLYVDVFDADSENLEVLSSSPIQLHV